MIPRLLPWDTEWNVDTLQRWNKAYLSNSWGTIKRFNFLCITYSKHPIHEDINCTARYMSLEFTKEVRDEDVHFRDFNI